VTESAALSAVGGDRVVAVRSTAACRARAAAGAGGEAIRPRRGDHVDHRRGARLGPLGFTETGIATRAVKLVTEWGGIPGWQFLVIVNILLLILGMFLEVFSVMLLTLP